MTSAACLGVEGKGKAPHFRLTEDFQIGQPPTRDFQRWDGTVFRNRRKQNPAPKRSDSVSPKVGTLLNQRAQESRKASPQIGTYGATLLSLKLGT
jgi:hypothetical protein